MSSFQFSNIALRGFAAATPDHLIKFDTSDRRIAKFVKQMGIAQVHLSITEQTAVDFGYVALQQALKQAAWTSSDLDLVIFDTQKPDFLGGTGNSDLIHHYLNLRPDCAAFDLSLGCAAFPYALTVACSMLQAAGVGVNNRRIAVIIGDIHWSTYKNRETLLAKPHHLFGECTGVILLEAVNAGSCPTIKTALFADGHGYKHLFSAPASHDAWHLDADQLVLPNGTIIDYRCNPRGDGKNVFFSYMDGIAIHEFSTNTVVESIKQHVGTALKDYDYYVFHQANRQILDTITERLELDPAKVLISLDQYGNTSVASALTTICHNLHDLDHPAHVFNASFGIGLNWGFSDFVIEPGTVSAIIETDHHFTEHCLKPIYTQPHSN